MSKSKTKYYLDNRIKISKERVSWGSSLKLDLIENKIKELEIIRETLRIWIGVNNDLWVAYERWESLKEFKERMIRKYKAKESRRKKLKKEEELLRKRLKEIEDESALH